MTPEAATHLLNIFRKTAKDPPPDVVVAEAIEMKRRRGDWCCNRLFLEGDGRQWACDQGIAAAKRSGHADCLKLAYLIRSALHRAKAIQARLDAIECGYDLRNDLRLY